MCVCACICIWYSWQDHSKSLGAPDGKHTPFKPSANRGREADGDETESNKSNDYIKSGDLHTPGKASKRRSHAMFSSDQEDSVGDESSVRFARLGAPDGKHTPAGPRSRRPPLTCPYNSHPFALSKYDATFPKSFCGFQFVRLLLVRVVDKYGVADKYGARAQEGGQIRCNKTGTGDTTRRDPMPSLVVATRWDPMPSQA